MRMYGKRILLSCLGIVALTGQAGADKNNRYEAVRAPVAPVIDGVPDPVWNRAAWDSIDVLWIGDQPTPQDYSGRYKAMWDSSKVYLLVEVVDDSIYDRYANPLTNYWDDDAVEIFLDENKNGGDHQYNFSAWAYHVSTKYDVVDMGTDQKARLFNDHIQAKRVQTGHVSIWELSMLVYGENYTLAGPNTPLKLAANKEMGFSLAYIDNDGSPNRENFMGSVNTPGHLDNQGYIDASCFGALKLLPDTTAGVPAPNRAPGGGKPMLRASVDGFRLTSSVPEDVEVRRMDGTVVDSFRARPGVTYGAKYPVGVYRVSAVSGDVGTGFAKLR